MGQAAFQEAYRHMNNAVSKQCRVSAYKATPEKKASVRQIVERWYQGRRTTGAIREKCTDSLYIIHKIKQNSCDPRITDLLKDKVLVETGESRTTSSGNPAAVIIHRDFAAEVFGARPTSQPALFDEPETAHYPG
jgi:hypothetical protein